MATELESCALVTDANGYPIETTEAPATTPADGGSESTGDSWPVAEEVPAHLRHLADAVHAAKRDLDNARANAKAAKRHYESALDSLIDAMNPPDGDSAGSTIGDSESFDHSDPEAWRRVTTKALGLSAGIVTILGESGITTLGAIADWSAAGKPFTDIPKIGEAKAEAIESAANGWWTKNPLPMAEAEAPPDEPTVV